MTENIFEIDLIVTTMKKKDLRIYLQQVTSRHSDKFYQFMISSADSNFADFNNKGAQNMKI